jgi:hypothetical protein
MEACASTQPCAEYAPAQLLTQPAPEAVAKRRRIVQITGGTFAYHQKVKETGLGYGFGTVAEYAEWPHWLVQQATQGPEGRARKARIEALLAAGIAMHTDCTGRMSIETAFRMMGVSLEHAGVKMVPGWFAAWRGCDVDPLCREMMLKAGDHGPMHVFGSLECRLPAKHLQRWQCMLPDQEASAEERIAAHAKMQAFLKANRHDIFGRDKTAPCLRHPGHDCYLSFRDPPGIPAGERPLTFAVAGVPCTPWSSLGSQTGMAHCAIPAILLWLADVANSNFDVIGIEESDRFPGELFSDAMPEKYVVKSLVFGPQDRCRIAGYTLLPRLVP